MQNNIWINREIGNRDWYNDGYTFSLLSYIISMSDSNWKVKIDVNDHPKMFKNDLINGISNLSNDGIIDITVDKDIIYVELINSEYLRIDKL